MTTVSEDTEKREPSCTVGGNVKCCSHYEKQLEIFQKIKNRTTMIQQFHSWVFIQGKQKTLIRKDICTPMFIAALSTIAKIWKQPKCPSTDEWIKMWYIYNRILAIKNNEIWASLVAQWLRICLPMQGTWVQALVWEDPTCRGAAGPVSHNY